MTMSEGTRSRVLEAVNRLVDRAPRHSDLAYHRLQVFAARHWRAQGRPVPGEFEREEQFAAVAWSGRPGPARAGPAAYDGPLLLLKGPEVAARYPDPTLRPFRNLDLLVLDAAAAQAPLFEACFTVVDGEYEKPERHHRAPLLAPGLPLVLELHDRPKCRAAKSRRRAASCSPPRYRQRPRPICSRCRPLRTLSYLPRTPGRTGRCGVSRASSTSL
jgi:hypothetical protein